MKRILTAMSVSLPLLLTPAPARSAPPAPAAPSAPDAATGISVNSPERIAQGFLAQLDRDDYAAAWKSLAPAYRQRTTEERWVGSVRGKRSELGASQSRKLSYRELTPQVPWMPAGKFMVMVFHGSFAARQKPVREVVVLQVIGTGWGIVGYSFDGPPNDTPDARSQSGG